MMYFLKRRLGYSRPEPNGHDKSVQVKPGNGCSPASMPSPMIKSQSDQVILKTSGAEIYSWSKANGLDAGGALEICSWSKANCFDEGEPLALETPRRTGLSGTLDQQSETFLMFLMRYYNIVFPTLIGITIACTVIVLICIQGKLADLKIKIADLDDQLSDLDIMQKELAVMEQHALSSNTSVSCDDIMKKLRQLERDGKLKTCILYKLLNNAMDKAPGNGDDMLLGYPKTEMIGASQNDSSLQKLEVDGPLFHESHLVSFHDTKM
ncbi:uncharacterized protein LOC131934622 [Physella acuta]|uniref:uncharacterized protein LOC131934622 n=1 Tax=Physella acuta TaxID=109671 RepID=UPI0027DC59E8|nr:uncharacterized protein LOC131934622 [Physella acuta]